MRALLVLCVSAAVIVAQDTRTGEIEAARDKKIAQLAPETVSKTENLLLQVKQQKLLERLTAGFNGLRVQFGNMATGSGFALGPEFFREDLAGGRLRFDSSAVISTRAWQKYQVGISSPEAIGGKVNLRLDATRRDYRSLEFYGIGPDSSKGGRTVYRLVDNTVEGSGAVQVVPHVRFGGTAGALWTHSGAGRRPEISNIGSVYPMSSTPALGRDLTYFRSSLFGQVDYRDDPAGPKSGGNYVAQYSWYNNLSDGSAYGFRRWDIDFQQYIPFFNRTRRIVLRGRGIFTDPGSGSRVPFYMQPFIGGPDDLRGFRPYRFTDRNAVVYNAEYRWEAFSGLDAALFFDAGKVMPHRGWMKFSDLETSAGFGLRFNARNRTFIRIDVGFSHEGATVWFKFNDPLLPRLFGTGTAQPLY